ncbi:zinc ribbon domain-containing protein [Methanobrevibacter ruminantium]|uniref:zinc ribbon domain-containing protein n=1 Tax=Methanobrevibacter ruminantium TaxID=83816 RepID=UPI0026F07555|nr:zinc ribbon domain-containing protein [Methanobrevibacter ruminantium]MCI5737780.1 zinc ribbon domain-containing protein [Methanobrevibacter ruminantium]
MVFCPNCGAENADSAKFCKQCGYALGANRPIKDNYVNTGIDPSTRVNDNSNVGSNNSNSKSDNKNLIIICLTIVICALLIAGAMVMFSNNNANDDSDALSDSASLNSGSVDNASDVEASTQESHPTIQSGSFSTGSSASDKTHCTIYVGSEHAGEKVKISVLYSYNGNALNKGNVVPKTVSSDGYVKVASASALDYYPDDAYITLYDNDGNVLDTKEIYLNTNSGKQTF